MNIIDQTDEELFELAGDWWAKLIKYSNNKNYLMFIEHFSKTLRAGYEDEVVRIFSVSLF